jgi:hypothetical protein
MSGYGNGICTLHVVYNRSAEPLKKKADQKEFAVKKDEVVSSGESLYC